MSDARQTTVELASQIAETTEARGATYGTPEQNFANIAGLWRAWISARYGFGIPLDAHDVGIMSALIKVARLAETPTHRDSALDGATYLLLGHGCAVAESGSAE